MHVKVTQKEIDEFFELIDQAEAFKPIVQKVIEKAKIFTPELLEILEGFRSTSVEFRSKSFYQYLEKGFSREEAMLLTLDSAASLRKSLKEIGNSRK